LFERAASEARDAELRAFAGRTLPTLQTHLAAAENIESTINAK
jgi:predicted outer membrane protein